MFNRPKAFLNQMRGKYFINGRFSHFASAIVHGIIKNESYQMEGLQAIGKALGANGSDFSDEDLMSNFLGFLSGFHHHSLGRINSDCRAILDKKTNLCLYDKIGKLGQQKEWRSPVDYNKQLEEVYKEKGRFNVVGAIVLPMHYYLYDIAPKIQSWPDEGNISRWRRGVIWHKEFDFHW